MSVCCTVNIDAYLHHNLLMLKKMTQQADIFDCIVQQRRSIRIYDNSISYDKSVVERSLQRAILSPNSSNMQLWEFYRIHTEPARSKVAEFCLGQLPATTASELVIFVARPDKYKKSIDLNMSLINSPDNFEKESRKEKRRAYYGKLMPLFYRPDPIGLFSVLKKVFVTLKGIKEPVVREVTFVNKKVTIHKSVALAAQTFMLSVSAEGYDTCPLEGVDSKRLKKYLGLPKVAEINMVIAVGKRAEDGVFYPRIRYPYQDVVKEFSGN